MLPNDNRERGAHQGQLQPVHLDEERIRKRDDGDLPQDSWLGCRRRDQRPLARDRAPPESQVPPRRDARRPRLPSARQHRALVARASTSPVVRLVREPYSLPRAADRPAPPPDGRTPPAAPPRPP